MAGSPEARHGRARHAQRSCLRGHELREFLFGAADGFSDDYRGIVRRFGHQPFDRVLDFDRLIGLEA